jgi:hypothetical protein
VRTIFTRDRSLRWLAAAGYGLGLAAMLLLVLPNGGLGRDAHAYWLAGRHVLDGTPLYDPHVAVETFGAWKYPPLFAQAIAPLSLMPELVFAWLLRIVSLLCLRGLVGSWRNVGLALLLPPVWTELSIVNVTFPVAYIALIALRGRPTFLPFAIALKFGPALLVPFILLRRGATDRRRLLVGMGGFAGLCALSILVSPDAWRDYLSSIGPQASGGIEGPGVIAFASSAAVDLAFRGSLAVAVTIIAIVIDEERLAWVAAVVTSPVLFVTRLVPLIALLSWRSTAKGPRLRKVPQPAPPYPRTSAPVASPP